MKTIFSIVLLAIFPCSALFATPTVDIEWKAVLEAQLSKVFDNTTFAIDDLQVNTDRQQLLGRGTFFAVSGVQFTAGYSAPGQIASFELTFPGQGKVSIKESSISRLAGHSLLDLVPGEIAGSVYLHRLGFTVSNPDKSLEKVDFWFKSPLQWTLLPGKQLPLQDIALHFQVAHPTDKNRRELRGILTGLSRIGSTPVKLEADISQTREDLTLTSRLAGIGLQASLQAMVGRSAFQGIPVPDALLDLQLQNGQLRVQPYRKNAVIAAQSNMGQVDVWMQKPAQQQDKLEYVVVITPPAGFKMSTLHPKLGGLDGINLSGQKIVLTSEEKNKQESAKIPSLSQMSAAIRRGCNLVTKLDLTRLRLEHLLRAKELVLSSPLGSHLNDIVLESAIDVKLPLGPNTQMSQVLFRLQPSPANFAIALVGVVDARVSKDNLIFKGGMNLVMSTQTLQFSSILEGNWRNPLGANGLVMSKVGLQLGGSFGGVAILPNLAFAGEIKIGRFAGQAAVAFDTRDPAKSMLSGKIEQLFVSDIMESVVDKKVMRKVPQEMQQVLQRIRFNDVYLEFVPQPLRVLEKTYAPGFRMGGNVDIMGVNGYGNMDIDYSNGLLAQGEVDPIDLGPFKLTGAGKNKRPGFVIDLRLNKDPKVALNGLVSILGMQAETEVEVLPNGFRFDLGGKVFNIFNGKVMVAAADLQRLGSMQTKVNMEQDLFGFLDREVGKFVENQLGDAIKKLSAAQRKIGQAQAKVSELDGLINQQRKIVRKEQAEKKAKYDAAQRNVTNAQKKVNGINSAINAKKRELKQKNKAWQAGARGVIRTQIAGLYTAKGVAWTALEGYKKVLQGLGKLNTNPDIHPRVAGLIGSKATAIGSLKAAKATLEGLKFTLGATGKAATFVMDKGTKALINVRKADFAGQLGALSGGAVDMNMKLEWMGKPMDLKIDFDFNSPMRTVAALGKKLLGK